MRAKQRKYDYSKQKKCPDCGVLIRNESTRCLACHLKKITNPLPVNYRKHRECPDCGILISRNASRCRSCAAKVNAVNQGRTGGRKQKKCSSCGKSITHMSTYCQSCYHKKQVGKNRPTYKFHTVEDEGYRKGKKCKDCGVLISDKALRCHSCASKAASGIPNEDSLSHNFVDIRSKSVHAPGLENWRRQVLARDFNRCTRCNSKKRLHVHHIESWAKHPESRLNVNNGATLCETCHNKLHRLYGHHTTIQQYDTFAIQFAKRKRLVKNLLATAALVLLFVALG